MIMITKKNQFSGASFDYTNENNCVASGEFRYEGDKLVSVNINGQITKEETTRSFWANMDSAGNVNISGVPADMIADVAVCVADIITEIKNSNGK